MLEATPIVFPPPLRFAHLEHLLTEIGLWQHTRGNKPHVQMGYSIDDEARGLIVALRHWEKGVEPRFQEQMGAACFRFLQQAALTEGPDAGRYHNFCDARGCWLDSIGSDNSFGRTLWSLGVACQINAPFAPRAEAEPLLRRSLAIVNTIAPPFLRAKAFVVLGLAASRRDDAVLLSLADALADAYETSADDGWRWFEGHMTYCNARLPQALFAAASVFPERARYARIAEQSLDFLLQVTRGAEGGYSPIGNAPLQTAGWFQRGQASPPPFDQQPVDAGALVEACVAAVHITGEARFRQAARDAFGWYHGLNCHGAAVYNSDTGAVGDALHAGGVSRNQGAESVLSYHLAHQALQELD